MMLFLVLNVSRDTRLVARAHPENGVARLPSEERAWEEVMLEKMRRSSFDMLHQPGEGNSCGHADKQVNMIGDASHGQDFTSVVVSDSLDVAMDGGSDFRLYPGHTIIGCPDKVQEGSIFDVGHASFSALRGPRSMSRPLRQCARFSGSSALRASSGGL